MRARRLYLRGRNYGLDALELAYPGFRKSLLSGNAGEAKAALSGSAKTTCHICTGSGQAGRSRSAPAKDDPQLFGDFGLVGQLMERALELDESFDEARSTSSLCLTTPRDRKIRVAGRHRPKTPRYRAEARRRKTRLPFVLRGGNPASAAKKAEFVKLLEQIVAADVYSEDPTWKKNRLANIIAQERSRWLLANYPTCLRTNCGIEMFSIAFVLSDTSETSDVMKRGLFYEESASQGTPMKKQGICSLLTALLLGSAATASAQDKVVIKVRNARSGRLDVAQQPQRSGGKVARSQRWQSRAQDLRRRHDG